MAIRFCSVPDAALREQIQDLYDDCRRVEPLKLGPLLPEEDEVPLLILDEEDGLLTAFLAVCTAEEGAIEVRGFTRPGFRRQGRLMRLMLSLPGVLVDGERPDFYFYTDRTSPDTEGFIRHLGCPFVDSEQIMVLDREAADRFLADSPADPDALITAVPCGDADTLAAVHSRIFGWTQGESRQFFSDALADPHCAGSLLFYNGKRAGCFLLIGSPDSPSVCLFGFGLFRRYQGKGLSKSALRAVLRSLPDTCPELAVQVTQSNAPAYGLYTSAGFRTKEQLDSYLLSAE